MREHPQLRIKPPHEHPEAGRVTPLRTLDQFPWTDFQIAQTLSVISNAAPNRIVHDDQYEYVALRPDLQAPLGCASVPHARAAARRSTA